MSKMIADPRLYRIWQAMKKRCFRSYRKDYKYYGGRGVTVCEAWLDFQIFSSWAMASGYENTLALDRVDNDGNYEPGNCQWLSIADNLRKAGHHKWDNGCKRGHPWTKENILINTGGRKTCRICHRERGKRSRLRRAPQVTVHGSATP